MENNIKNARVRFGLFHLHLGSSFFTFHQDNWQPALEKLVASIGEKFSAAFDRKHIRHSVVTIWNFWLTADLRSCFFLGISCAGEIRISQHDEYEKWAIDILVKFRDSEKLQLLTAHRQSGGVHLFQFLHTQKSRRRPPQFLLFFYLGESFILTFF